MNSFYHSPVAEQSAIMACVFFALIVSLLFLLMPLDKSNRRWLKCFNACLGAALFALEAVMGHGFRGMTLNEPYPEILTFSMWQLWCVAGAAILLLILEAVLLAHTNKNALNRDAVKQSVDNLPGALCYFTKHGTVKLCNHQMHKLFRILTETDLQSLEELRQALAECNSRSGVICLSAELKAYLFPDGKVWQYFEKEITADDGVTYIEAVFTDVTELYEKGLVLEEQLKQLKKVNRNLKYLSDNVFTLTREQEILTAKTRLHDQMGGGVLAIRRILQHTQSPKETREALEFFRKAVDIIKYDNQSPVERSELAEFMRDADAIGVEVELFGELPERDESYLACILAMRECLTNSVRHADATKMKITVLKSGNCAIMNITNNGAVPECEVVPKGGLLNLSRHIENVGGTMKIESKPIFKLTVSVPLESSIAHTILKGSD